MKHYILLMLSWFLLVVAVLCGAIGAIAAFFGLAFVVSNTVILCIAAILACVLIASGLARISAEKIARQNA